MSEIRRALTQKSPSPLTFVIATLAVRVFSESEAVIMRLPSSTYQWKLSRIDSVFLELITLLTPDNVE